MHELDGDVDPAELQLVADLARAEQNGEGPMITIHLQPYTAYVLVAALQLVHRHPGLADPLASHIEQLARQVQAGFQPPYSEILERGWEHCGT